MEGRNINKNTLSDNSIKISKLNIQNFNSESKNSNNNLISLETNTFFSSLNLNKKNNYR